MEKIFQFNYTLLDSWKSLSDEHIALVEKAYESMERAYAPYSKFKVGAAAKLSNGTVVLGNNQENIAYPSGLCAERVALFYAGANFPNEEVDVIVIVARGELMPDKQLLSPCGSCRQVMLETENRQSKPMKVILVNQDERTMIINSVQHLLPFGFGTFD
ncbi:MAG: cytidine deaminase [Flavobacteriales bacterium]|nr:cytidine deaminase [Flavobacteriales bacterium]NCA20505.1 cytidine deaminase [Crocinitomicaceae bacterium]